MLFRKIYAKVQDFMETDKILFLVGARQVGKTTIMRSLFDQLQTDKKLFLNMENREYHSEFVDISSIINLLSNYGYKPGKKFYLFLDEFHLVDQIDWKLKVLYDDYRRDIKVVCSGSNNILINSAIKESFAGRKTIISLYPLDFAEYIIRKNFDFAHEKNQPLARYKKFSKNPLNKNLLKKELETFLVWGSMPEVVLASEDKRKDILKDIFDRWLYRDIFGSVKKDSSFVSFMKYIGFNHGQQINFNELASYTGVSSHTIRHYLFLLEETYIGFQVKPFFTNKLKELVKAPKFYFLDSGLRNMIINRFEFSPEEYGALFEGFVFSELLKGGEAYQDIQWWRTADNSHEVDFVLSGKKKIIEAKYADKLTGSDHKGIQKFSETYSGYKSSIISQENFLNIS